MDHALNPVKLGHIVVDGEAMLFLCDMQDRFRNAIHNFDKISQVCNRLTTASKILGVPLIVTEQYPKGLGKTVSDITIDHAVGVFPKTKFSMIVPEVQVQLESRLKATNKCSSVILCGVETHVCIQQTVIDLMARGHQVHVVADAVSSRNPTDRRIALDRFRQMGAFVTSSESILFQLVGDKEHPHFKEIQALIKQVVTTGLYPDLE